MARSLCGRQYRLVQVRWRPMYCVCVCVLCGCVFSLSIRIIYSLLICFSSLRRSTVRMNPLHRHVLRSIFRLLSLQFLVLNQSKTISILIEIRLLLLPPPLLFILSIFCCCDHKQKQEPAIRALSLVCLLSFLTCHSYKHTFLLFEPSISRTSCVISSLAYISNSLSMFTCLCCCCCCSFCNAFFHTYPCTLQVNLFL